jgi:hypothetical protein
MTKYLFIFTFVFQLSVLAVNIQGQEVLDNGELWRQENFMKDSLEKNIKALGKISKSPIYDSCPSQKLPDGSNDQTNIIEFLSNFKIKDSKIKIVGNFQFWTYNTKSFYTKNEYKNLPCEMDVTLLLHNFPEHLRNPNEDSVYWDKELIAQRWKIASQSLKECGIRIRNMNLTSFEFQDRYKDRKPDYDLSTAITSIIPAPFHENDKKRGSKSVIVAYVNEISEGEKSPPQRGDRKYPVAAIARDTVFIRRDAIYLPIFPEGIPPDLPGFVVETHEVGGHVLTGEDDLQSHFNTFNDPNRYDAMSDMWSRASGKFMDDRCPKMVQLGQDRGYLRCSMKYAKAGTATSTR